LNINQNLYTLARIACQAYTNSLRHILAVRIETQDSNSIMMVIHCSANFRALLLFFAALTPQHAVLPRFTPGYHHLHDFSIQKEDFERFSAYPSPLVLFFFLPLVDSAARSLMYARLFQ
jgi:hypothetical protein